MVKSELDKKIFYTFYHLAFQATLKSREIIVFPAVCGKYVDAH